MPLAGYDAKSNEELEIVHAPHIDIEFYQQEIQ